MNYKVGIGFEISENRLHWFWDTFKSEIEAKIFLDHKLKKIMIYHKKLPEFKIEKIRKDNNRC